MEFDRYRLAGATARQMLVEAAAKRFEVAPSAIRTESGVVIAGDKRATYGELADAAGQLPVPDPKSITFKEAKDWKVIGKPTNASTHRRKSPAAPSSAWMCSLKA